MNDCPKCGGSGFIGAFGHIVSGRCFLCGGTGRVKPGAASQKVGEPAPTWEDAECVITQAGERYEVMSRKSGAVVYVFADGVAVATDGVREGKSLAEKWAAERVARIRG
jgi:hypothetical protein